MIATSSPTQRPHNAHSQSDGELWPAQFGIFFTPPAAPSAAEVRPIRLAPLPRVVVEDMEHEDPFAADEGHIRFDLVNRVRNQIAQGTYEPDDKIDAMLDRLALDLGSW